MSLPCDAMMDPDWKSIMDEEMITSHNNQMQELTLLLLGK